ncbi:3D domain-containing protein [Desulfosporosinus sp. Sb-LF]|uniref:3D domain-containing protein n=1 Tax=Desulfosporosinus sp. Sb-LF TaxID=2560027 RepID=UPI00107EF204|nr:3D domain-containing protein [Desulfosporosinus sp. Sb-LF]TGE34059.1 DUF348 domain-containing protein [Desulfosporosinus sp. Sb-LF]
MFELTRTRVLSLVKTSRIAQVVIALCAFFIIVTGTFVYNAKTIDAHIDGKTVRITTIYGTVGQALDHSNLKSYPEDIVKPSRDTKVTKGLTIEVTRSVPVHLSVDEQTFMTRTPAKTVGEALVDLSERNGLQIKDVDEVNVPRTDAVVDQMEIKVRRAIPILVRADGKTINTYIAPRTVAETLKKLGIALGIKDKVSLPIDHMLVPNEQVQVVRVAERIETIKGEIPFQNVIQAADYPVGLPDKVISRGSNGLQEQTVRLTLEDGKEVDREILGQRVVTTPINQVTSRGAQTSVSRGGETIRFKQAYVMTATAYCIPGGTTRTGAPVRWGIIAVDPRVISLGENVYVDGYGRAQALDTGGAIIGNRIDLYMNSQEAAASWGVRTVMVYVQ